MFNNVARKLFLVLLGLFLLSGSNCGQNDPHPSHLGQPTAAYGTTGNANGGPGARASSMNGPASVLANLISDYRAHAGLPTVSANDVLTGVAQVQADDMAASNAVGLVGTDGEDAFQRLANSGYANVTVAVIAAGYSTDPTAVYDAMLTDSSANQALLLGNSAFNSIGVGYSNGYWMVILGNIGTATGSGSGTPTGPTGPGSCSTSTFVSGLNGPTGLAFDAAGNLYVANSSNNTVSKVTPAGVASTFATGINFVIGLAFDSAGNLYAASFTGGTVTKITPAGVTSTFLSGLSGPQYLAFDTSGNLYVVCQSGNSITEATPAGMTSTFVTGLSTPIGVAFDATGNLYVDNQGTLNVNKVTPAGVSSVYVSSGLSNPQGMVFDSSGNLYIANAGAAPNTILQVTPAGVATTFLSGLNYPTGMAFDAAGTLYIANNGTNSVVKVSCP